MAKQDEEEVWWQGFSLAEGIYIHRVDPWYRVLKGCVGKIFVWKLPSSYYCQICHVRCVQSVTCDVSYKGLPPYDYVLITNFCAQ